MANAIPFGRRQTANHAWQTYVNSPEFMTFDSFHQHLVEQLMNDYNFEGVSGSRWTELQFTIADKDVGRATNAADAMMHQIARRYGALERKGFKSEWKYDMSKDGSACVHTYSNPHLQMRVLIRIQRTMVNL